MNYTDHSIDRIVQIAKSDGYLVGLSESGRVYQWDKNNTSWNFLGDSPPVDIKR